MDTDDALAEFEAMENGEDDELETEEDLDAAIARELAKG